MCYSKPSPPISLPPIFCPSPLYSKPLPPISLRTCMRDVNCVYPHLPPFPLPHPFLFHFFLDTFLTNQLHEAGHFEFPVGKREEFYLTVNPEDLMTSVALVYSNYSLVVPTSRSNFPLVLPTSPSNFPLPPSRITLFVPTSPMGLFKLCSFLNHFTRSHLSVQLMDGVFLPDVTRGY